MTKLSEKDVLHVAKLAHLEIKAQELRKFQSQLSAIVEFVSQLAEVKTEGVEPTSQTTGLENVERTDEIKVENGLTNEQALSGTDSSYSGYFSVGRVIKK